MKRIRRPDRPGAGAGRPARAGTAQQIEGGSSLPGQYVAVVIAERIALKVSAAVRERRPARTRELGPQQRLSGGAVLATAPLGHSF
jgi:hypothetical protein